MLRILLSCLALVLPGLASAQVAADVPGLSEPVIETLCFGGVRQAWNPLPGVVENDCHEVTFQRALRLRPRAATSTRLRAEPPAQAKAARGDTLTLPLPVRNLSAQTVDVSWGASSYDYELLDAAGRALSFQGIRLFAAVAYGMRCPPQALCQPDFALSIPLDHASWGTLRPGDYTLRVSLRELWVDGQTHDLGTLDIPLTLR